MACSKSISFSEVVQGREARVRVTDDGMIYAVDLVMVMTGKCRNDAGQALRNLPDEVFSSVKFTEKNTGGSGGSRTKLVSFEDSIELVMVLPGKVAKETRRKFANIIQRYLAGDKSLVAELEGNAESSSPIAQLARDSLASAGGDAVEDHEARRKRIKREDLELIRLEEEILEMRTSNKDKQIQNLHSFMNLMSTIRPDWMQTDVRFRLQTEDMIKNIMAPQPLMMIGDGSPAEPRAAQPASLSISQLASELGCRPLSHANAIAAGRLAAKRYRAIHDADPPKHRQWVDGAERVVNSYTEKDRGMLTAVLVDMGLTPAGGGGSCSSSVTSGSGSSSGGGEY